ncbi:hypothetical protein ACFQX8_08095 [Klenkia terrae]|uniref:hypothetical protein n=1 Tax=Klenkia terrae TaxID=1052259 RepID=UPI003619C9D6
MTRLSPQLYRTALDLVAARQQDEYAVFEVVLEELSGAPDGLGVLGVLAVTNLSVRQASAVGRCPASRVLDGLRVQPVPAAQPVVPTVLTLLYTATEDLGRPADWPTTSGPTTGPSPAWSCWPTCRSRWPSG